MTKEMIMSGEIYWVDIDGNAVVEAPDGEIYLITESGKTVWIAEQLSDVRNEEGDYMIDGMDIAEYIQQIKEADETTVYITEAVLPETQKTYHSEFIETSAPITKQTVYGVSQTQITKNTEVSKNEFTQTSFSEAVSVDHSQ